MAHFPVLVDFWKQSTDPSHTLTEVWTALAQDYAGMADISDTTIRQKLNGKSTLAYMKDESGQKIILRYDHNTDV